MSDATITPLRPSTVERTTPRDCGVARIIELPVRATGRLIDPLPRNHARPVSVGSVPTSAEQEGPLARALAALQAGGR